MTQDTHSAAADPIRTAYVAGYLAGHAREERQRLPATTRRNLVNLTMEEAWEAFKARQNGEAR